MRKLRPMMLVLLLGLCLWGLCACGGSAPEATATPEPTITPEPTATPVPTPSPEPTPAVKTLSLGQKQDLGGGKRLEIAVTMQVLEDSGEIAAVPQVIVEFATETALADGRTRTQSNRFMSYSAEIDGKAFSVSMNSGETLMKGTLEGETVSGEITHEGETYAYTLE